MNKLNKLVTFLVSSLASLALIIGTASVNSACILYVYQPPIPKAMEKFKK